VRNLRLLCRTHNGYFAEREYGKDVMDHHRNKGRSRSRVRESIAVYAYANRDT
jgi:hypothetical protein